MKFRVEFTPEAEDQLAELLIYIGSAASPEIAERYIDAIVEKCEKLETFPLRGTARDDIRPGLRVLGFHGE